MVELQSTITQYTYTLLLSWLVQSIHAAKQGESLHKQKRKKKTTSAGTL